MTPLRYHSSKPAPTQNRWNDWGHGRIEPMDDERSVWPAVAIAITVVMLVGAMVL